MKRSVKIIFFIVLPVILALIIVVALALPYGLKKYINEHGIEYTGRKMSVRDIKINYLKSSFNILDFKMYEADGQTNFVSFDTMMVKIFYLPLLTSKLVVEKFRLVNPAISVIRKDSIYNFDDIPAFYNAKPKPENTGEPAKPFEYYFNNISVERGVLVFEDKIVNHITDLNNLDFFIPSLIFNQDEIKDAGINFHFKNGGSFKAKTDFNQKSGSYKLDFTVEKLDISPFLPYAKGYFHIGGIGGLVAGNFQLSGNINKLDSILLSGKSHVDEFSASDLNGHKVLGAKGADVTIADTYPMRFNFKFGNILLNEPYLYVEMKDSTINLLNLMVETPTDTVPFTYSYQINKFRIENGMLDLRDNSFEAPFDYHLSEIAMKVDSISSAAKWLNAYSTMKLNQRGKLQAELGINPSDPYELKVNYVITNFQLSDLNIPLKLALYLLKDIHGDIILDLPLTGDMNDPKTNIRKLVWTTLKNVVVKVVASPFIALSGLLGVEPAEVKGIEFNYRDTTLTPTHLRRIKLYTELEKKKPDMKVELNYYNDVSLEKNDIAVDEAGKLFFSATGGDYRKEQEKFSAFLRTKLNLDTVSDTKGSFLLIGEHNLDSIQQSISRMRILKVEAALRSFDDSSRIKVVIPNREVPENVGSRPNFELKFSIEE